MFHAFVRTLLKVTIASLIVGTVLAHFGVTTDRIMREVGLSQDRVLELREQIAAIGLKAAYSINKEERPDTFLPFGK